MTHGIFGEVTKDEFDHFVAHYRVHGAPYRLEYDYCTISYPALGSFNDFTGGKVWPESIVAKELVADDGTKYFIREGD